MTVNKISCNYGDLYRIISASCREEEAVQAYCSQDRKVKTEILLPDGNKLYVTKLRTGVERRRARVQLSAQEQFGTFKKALDALSCSDSLHDDLQLVSNLLVQGKLYHGTLPDADREELNDGKDIDDTSYIRTHDEGWCRLDWVVDREQWRFGDTITEVIG